MKLRVLEWLRGGAALSVALAHTDSLFGGNPALPFGRLHDWSFPGTAGVEFFFVLSGFVMGMVHGGEVWRGGKVLRFLWRRACRIYPIYWVLLAVPVHQFWAAPVVTLSSIAGWASLMPVRMDNLLVVAWTLRQEVTFYLIFAACLVPRIGPAVLLGWIGLTVTNWFVAPLPLPASVSVVGAHVFSLFNFEFFAGLLAGWVFRTRPGAAWPGGALLALGLGLVAWRMSLDGWGAEYGPVIARPVYGAGYGAIILGSAMLERAGVLRFGRVGTALALGAGALSYPLYLSHLLTLDAVVGEIGPGGVAARLGAGPSFVLLLTACVAVAAVLAFAVDRPLQRGLRRIRV